MGDDEIVSLYWERSEQAIEETEKKYGRYLMKIARNILADVEDCRECVNDTWLKAWNSMPPQRPRILSTYLGRITRQAAIDCFRRRTSVKRRASEYAVSLSELEECVCQSNISGGNVTEQQADLHLLTEAINRFLYMLTPEARILFVSRYYFMDSVREAAACGGMSESKAKSMLHRTRLKLKKYLEEEGFLDESGRNQ